MYAISAQYQHMTSDGWFSSEQVPTFYLDENVQGFLDEAGAVKVARTILRAGVRAMPVNDTFHIHAVKV